MSKEIKYTDAVPNSIVTRYKEDNIQYLLDQVARLTAENAMLKEKWSAPKQPEQEQEQEQEPVAWIIETEIYGKLSEWVCTDKKHYLEAHDGTKDPIPLYLAPPKREPTTEPVAWIIVNKETGYRTQVSYLTPFLYHREIFEVIPLYTAPPKREPLSDKEITKNTPKLIHIGERLAFHAGVRFAEKHHGIGDE